MALSPIEMMVDKATGFDPTKIKPKRRQDIDPAAQALLAVADAAVAWWKAINIMRRKNVDGEETDLEEAVKQWLKACGEI